MAEVDESHNVLPVVEVVIVKTSGTKDNMETDTLQTQNDESHQQLGRLPHEVMSLDHNYGKEPREWLRFFVQDSWTVRIYMYVLLLKQPSLVVSCGLDSHKVLEQCMYCKYICHNLVSCKQDSVSSYISMYKIMHSKVCQVRTCVLEQICPCYTLPSCHGRPESSGRRGHPAQQDTSSEAQ